MWRRTYFLLLFVRLYFAINPSYLHPDEHFQGPETIAGRIFDHPIHQTWEFSSEAPVRTVLPLWIVYGLPMLLMRSIFGSDVSRHLVAITLRLVMFGLSFVLEDWALHELADSRSRRRTAVLLVASSYVTWTWQVHTFSNAIETILVLWSLVQIKRVQKINSDRNLLAAAVLAFLLVFGTFNRITFPAFVAVPLLPLTPFVIRRPAVLVVMLLSAALTVAIAVLVDTSFYSADHVSIESLLRSPVITPLNSLLYNSQASNLALHGTHPFYQHFVVNLPQLLGPAYLLLILGQVHLDMALASGLAGATILSCFPHQEARFMLPAVPLILSSVAIPPRVRTVWLRSWIVFNVALALLMGIFHQGGILPAQIYLGKQSAVTQAFWWKTYSPPLWLLGDTNDRLRTVDLMGMNSDALVDRICMSPDDATVLVAPWSATFLDQFADDHTNGMHLSELWKWSPHLNLDDMDFGDDGVAATIRRVVGRRGLVIWKVECPQQDMPSVMQNLQRDW